MRSELGSHFFELGWLLHPLEGRLWCRIACSAWVLPARLLPWPHAELLAGMGRETLALLVVAVGALGAAAAQARTLDLSGTLPLFPWLPVIY